MHFYFCNTLSYHCSAFTQIHFDLSKMSENRCPVYPVYQSKFFLHVKSCTSQNLITYHYIMYNQICPWITCSVVIVKILVMDYLGSSVVVELCSSHKNNSHGVLTQFSCSKTLFITCSRSHRVHSHHLVVVSGSRRQSSQLNRECEVGSSEVVPTLSLLVEGRQ